MQQDPEILWPRPGCSIHEPWPPFAPYRSCPTAHCAFGGSPSGWRGLTGKQPRAMIVFFSNPYLKLLSDMIFKDQQGHSKQGFKVVSKMRGPNLSRSQRECCPSKNNMIHYQWSYLTHPWIWMAIWPRSTDPLSTKQRRFPAPWQSGPAQIAEWMKMEVGLPIQDCDLPRM